MVLWNLFQNGLWPNKTRGLSRLSTISEMFINGDSNLSSLTGCPTTEVLFAAGFTSFFCCISTTM